MPTEPAGTPAAPRACRCCGSAALTFRGSRHSRFLHRDFSFWHCAACDYLFVEPFSGYAIYDDVYYRGEGPDPFVDYESEYRDYGKTDRVLEFDDLADQATRYAAGALPEGAIEWLDYGCGAGGLLKYLSGRKELRSGDRRWPVRVSGSDVGIYADRLRRDDGFRILGRGELEAEPDARYDVISLIEVVEHIEYPDPVFALAARLLKPGGL